MSLLRQRETYGHVNKKKIKNSIIALQNSEIVRKLRAVDKSDDFIQALSAKYIPDDAASFEDNIFMDIIPAALSQKTQAFKDDILARRLRLQHPGRLERLLWIVLIEAGANPNVLEPMDRSYPITQVSGYGNDNDYAQALLARGANPNVAVKNFSQKHLYTEEHTPLCHVYNLELAKLMVYYGANVKAISSRSKKTFLHLVAEEERFPSELIQFYIDNDIDVNAEDACSSTPLEGIILDQSSHASERDHKKLQDKVSTLLNNGARYQSAIKTAGNALICDIPAYVKKDKILYLYAVLTAHHAYTQEAARLRNINLN